MPITTCDSPETLRAEIDSARKKVTLNETEDTWDTIAQGIVHLTRLCNIGGCQFSSEMVVGIRSISRPLNNALNSERSRLSGAAIELVTALAIGLGPSFEPLVSQSIPALLALCSRTNKVFTSRARACILAIVQHTQLPSLLPYFAELANHKSVFPRLTAAECILACLNCFNPPDLEKESRARIVEDFIKLTARDANADVRKASKEVFKAYKTLMPHRVASFVAPLTPVVKKYLDIQAGPSSNHGTLSNAVQKQTSRPSSRATNKRAEADQRPARGLPTAAEVRAPRQRTVSHMQRDPPPHNLQASSTAQRCAVPTSAPARPAIQHPAPNVARILPVRGTSSSAQRPQRPPPAQIKLNPPSDRLKVPGNGAKRIPLPSVPVNGQPGEQAVMAAKTVVRAGVVDESRTKLPSRNVEAVASGKLTVGRKAFEGLRSASASTKPANGSALTAPTVVQRPDRPLVKDKINPSGAVPHQRPADNTQKDAPPMAKVRKDTSPALVPLPPSPSAPPTEIPLPPSPDCTSYPANVGADKPITLSMSGPIEPTENRARSAEPRREHGDVGAPSTPITTLLASIQRGFLFTPSSPLSPPQNYLPTLGNMSDTTVVKDVTKGLVVGAPLDGLDRHALRDLN